MPILAVANEYKITLVVPSKLFNAEITAHVNTLINDFKVKHIEPTIPANKKPLSKWTFPESDEMRIELEFEHIMKRVVWHTKGDYFATLADNIQTSS